MKHFRRLRERTAMSSKPHRRSFWYLCKHAPPYALRYWRKRALRRAYWRGRARRAADQVPAEEADPTIVATGRSLREQLLAANERKHAAAGYRVLMFRPGSITGQIWFDGLSTCMRHAG